MLGIFKKNQHKDVDFHASQKKRRKHKVVPFIENPLSGANEDEKVFSQRHEANTLELFFDLFFVANLATFTTYHSINDHYSLLAYVGFFAIIWSTWYQVTLHDVRFARDCIYERACKTIQFIVFVGFALVGSAFTSGRDKTGTFNPKKSNSGNFRLMCYCLILSRALFALQYLIVFIFTVLKKGYNKLYFPLLLNTGIFILAAAVFGIMVPQFKDGEMPKRSIYGLWYVVLFVESAATIGISSIWRMLSFKKTHLVERMGLLTLIVIGEGAIGVTKTVSRMMSKSGIETDGSVQVMCIIFILMFLWMLYFDNQPHGHYGTIRQQVWSALHFPLHLSIVGAVEGSQQISLAFYTLTQWSKIFGICEDLCNKNTPGPDIAKNLTSYIKYFKLDYKPETLVYYPNITWSIEVIGNETDVCADGMLKDGNFPDTLNAFVVYMVSAIYSGLGVKLPGGKTDDMVALIAIDSWRIVYVYYLGSFALLLICLAFLLFLIRKNKTDLFDWVSMISRALVAIVFLCMMPIAFQNDGMKMYELLATPYILPIVVILLFAILALDYLSRGFANWRLRKSGHPYDDESVEEHHEEHGHHDEKNNIHTDVNSIAPSFTQDTAYASGHQHHMQPTTTANGATYMQVYQQPPVY